jgi:hypothetical protein
VNDDLKGLFCSLRGSLPAFFVGTEQGHGENISHDGQDVLCPCATSKLSLPLHRPVEYCYDDEDILIRCFGIREGVSCLVRYDAM